MIQIIGDSGAAGKKCYRVMYQVTDYNVSTNDKGYVNTSSIVDVFQQDQVVITFEYRRLP